MDATFDTYSANAQVIFGSFPNERVWSQGGLAPNRQLQEPEAGYCIVLRFAADTTDAISDLMTQIRSILPPVVEYNERNLHSTIGVYGKQSMSGFVPDPVALKGLRKSVEEGLCRRPHNPRVELGHWLFNSETILIPGYPNHDLWQLAHNIGYACNRNGHALEMVRITHVTTARFINGVTYPIFQQFVRLVRSAPHIGSVMPAAIDLATWRCDGLMFELDTHHRYHL